MSERTRRIDQVWYYLSLDLIRAYLNEMWFPFSDEKILDGMRQQIEPGEIPTFGSDSEWRIRRRLSWFGKEFGILKLNALLQWQQEVFEVKPNDRIAESWWSIAVTQLTHHRDRFTMASEIVTMLGRVCEESTRLESLIDERLEHSAQNLSVWDADALKKQAPEPGSVQDHISSVIYGIASTVKANNFARIWQDHTKKLQLNQLLELREVALNAVKEFGGPPYLGAPFPGIWEPFLATWLGDR